MAQVADDITANLKWARYQEEIKDFQSGLRMIPESFIFPGGKPSPMPECWYVYRRMKEWNTLWTVGGLSNQPEFLMQIMDACASGENRYHGTELPHLRELENQASGRKQTPD